MASLNKVTLIGNLGKDVEMRYTASGDAVANLSVATTESWKDKNTGEKKDQTDWHRVAFFGKIAEICGQYLSKGSQVYIEGSIHTRKWKDSDGQDRYTTEIRGSNMVMLGARTVGDRPADPPKRREPEPQQKPASSFDELESDLPF